MTDCNTRICTKCGNEYPLTADFFQPAKGYKYGFNTQCRNCRRKDARNYPSTKSDKKKKSKSEHAKRPDVIKRRNDRRRERYAKDFEFREYVLTSSKKTRIKNPEVTKAKKADEYKRHKDRYKASMRKYYLENRDIFIERARKQKPNPVSVIVRAERRLARKRALPDTLTKEQWLYCLEYFNHQCIVCGRLFDKHHKANMDHWIPLKNPKCLGTVANNIVCLCGKCNTSKASRDAELWLMDFYPLEKVSQIMERVGTYFELIGDL